MRQGDEAGSSAGEAAAGAGTGWMPAVGRLHEVAGSALGPSWVAARERIAATHEGRVDGPYAVLARQPELAVRVAALEEYFRLASSLPGPERELVTLVTARQAGADFCWAVHEHAGARAEVVESIRSGAGAGLSDREALLIELATALAAEGGLSADLYARAVGELGEPGVVEIVTLVGHYRLVALLLNAFEVPAPASEAPVPEGQGGIGAASRTG